MQSKEKQGQAWVPLAPLHVSNVTRHVMMSHLHVMTSAHHLTLDVLRATAIALLPPSKAGACSSSGQL
jgi:hypothetical protein